MWEAPKIANKTIEMKTSDSRDDDKKPSVETLTRENREWREWFLQQKLERGAFRHVSKEDRIYLEDCFKYLPSESFKSPEDAWSECLASALQRKRDVDR